ncbi:MAG: hypothetical protein LBU88_03580 [Treponema sp.]|jgi:hypothetical protein|nr:hypothetical protein [Treponema sp.]
MKHKAGVIFLIILISLPIQLSAQDSNPDVDDWEDFRTELYVRGDQTIIISAGTVFPLIFLNNGKKLEMNFTPPVGGSGSFAYNYYLTSNLFFGGEIAIQFMPSIRNDTLFIVPLGARIGYQFLFGKIEIPISAGFGMSWQRFLNAGYYGIYARGGLGVYFRATTGWSFGLTTNWYWIPQWTNDSERNVDGHMLDLLLSARYHF